MDIVRQSQDEDMFTESKGTPERDSLDQTEIQRDEGAQEHKSQCDF